MQDWVAKTQQASILQQHSTNMQIWTAAVFVAVNTLGQQAYMLQLQQRSNSLEWHSARQQACLIKFHTVSWHVWWTGISLVSFSLIFTGPRCMSDWMVPSPHAYLLKIYQIAAIYCHEVITSDFLTITHVYLCGNEPAHLPVYETQEQQSSV